MADNTLLNLGSGGNTTRDKDRTGVHTQIVLCDVGGASGSEAVLGDTGVLATLVSGVTFVVTANAGTNLNTSALATAAKQPALGTAGAASTDVITVQGIASGTAQPISGTVTANAGTNLNTSALATAAKQPALGTAGTASADVITVQGVTSMTALKVDGSGVTQPVSGTVTANAGSGTMAVSVASIPSHAVTNAGTFAVQSAVAGDVSSGSSDSGNPVKQGGKVTTSLSALTQLTDSQRSDFRCGTDGVQLVRQHTNLEDIVSGNANNTDGTSTSVIAAQAAGIKTYLTSIILTNMSATGIYVEIKDGSTVKVTIPLPANSGCVFNPPVPLPGSAATAWNYDPSAAATTTYCSMIGFKSKI